MELKFRALFVPLMMMALAGVSAMSQKQQQRHHHPQERSNRNILQQQFLSRRTFTAGVATATVTTINTEIAAADPMAALIPMSSGAPMLGPSSDGDWTDMPRLSTKLASSRIAVPIPSSISPLQQPAFGSQELFYPTFLFGSWNVTSTLKRKIYPFGVDFAPSKSLVEGSPRNRSEKVGDTKSYEARYFSALVSDSSALEKVDVDMSAPVSKAKIIADRSFNAVSMSRAYEQLAPIQQVDWDYSADPTRLTVRFESVSGDMRPLGPRRGEVYISARTSEQPKDNLSVFATAERTRSVTLATSAVIVSDMETITEFTRVDQDRVQAISRVAVYLTPNPNSREGVLWQQVGGKAIAFFDYEIEMKRLDEKCVLSPKGTRQCRG